MALGVERFRERLTITTTIWSPWNYFESDGIVKMLNAHHSILSSSVIRIRRHTDGRVRRLSDEGCKLHDALSCCSIDLDLSGRGIPTSSRERSGGFNVDFNNDSSLISLCCSLTATVSN